MTEGRLAQMIAEEEAILQVLTEGYQRGALEYLHYSPAYDMTACRLFALRSMSLAHLEADHG